MKPGTPQPGHVYVAVYLTMARVLLCASAVYLAVARIPMHPQAMLLSLPNDRVLACMLLA